MFGDILDWKKEKYQLDCTMRIGLSPEEISINKITYLWKEKRKPIEDQSEECINYIFNQLP